MTREESPLEPGTRRVAVRSPGGGSAETAQRPTRFSSRYRKRRAVSVMTLNLTPMIDVVFLLLFFFLLVTRFRVEGMLPAQLPARRAGVTTDVPQTPIRIRFAGTADRLAGAQVIVEPFGETPIPVDALAGALRQIRDTQPGFDAETPVHLLVGDVVLWDHVVNSYNAALAAEYEQVFFANPS